MVVLYWKDLILKSRIKEQAAAMGTELKFVRNLEEIKGLIDTDSITRLIVDLSAGVEFAKSFAGILKPGIQAIGVISHVDLDTHQAAEDAGFSEVIPRSALVNNLVELLN